MGRLLLLTRNGAKMAEPRFDFDLEGGLTGASSFWRLIEGRSGSE